MLYKFEAKLEQTLTAYFAYISSEHSIQEDNVENQLAEEIDAIEFMNFKYRTALISTTQDITRLEQQLQHEGIPLFIVENCVEKEMALIKKAQEELHLTKTVINKNKAKYQSMAKKIVAIGEPEELENEIHEVRATLEETEEEYFRDMEYYNEKERLLRTSVIVYLFSSPLSKAS